MVDFIRGVNVGGWLVLERWLTPSIFEGTDAWDEHSLCEVLDEQKQAVLTEHYDSWITKADFEWISKHGLNTVRIPVGYWLFGDTEPYIGGVAWLDKAFDWAKITNLNIIIDLHGAPGSQNGLKHSGQAGQVGWHRKPANIQRTLDVIERLAKRYGKQPKLLAIEALNEPDYHISKAVLTDYYEQAFIRIRKYSQAAVIMSDAWRPQDWQRVLPTKQFPNTWLDTHLYQVFSKEDQRLSMYAHLKKAQSWQPMLSNITSHPVIIGEWSLALPPKALRGMGEYERDKAIQAYGRSQLKAFSDTKGWCYWTYKSEDSGPWNLRDCVSRGWLQADFKNDLVE